MANQNKIQDPRQWKRWRDLEALADVVIALLNKYLTAYENAYPVPEPDGTAVSDYARQLTWIRRGDFSAEYRAIELADNEGLPLEPLRKAVKEGARTDYERYIGQLEQGVNLPYFETQREKAKKHGLPLDRLNSAFRKGCQRDYDTHVQFISPGAQDIDLQEKEARIYAVMGNLSLRPLEEALKRVKG